MAGPGGGAPRRSHTKSRLGCKTCKKRHIRCDEQFPQCQNCTKHSCRCDYLDSAALADDVPRSPRRPDLQWTEQVDAEVNAWLLSGTFPFPEIRLSTYEHFKHLSKVELRLIHHLCAIYQDLHRRDMLSYVTWVEKIPSFLDIGAGYDYVMNAIFAFSATHLAWLTKSPETTNMAYHYRGIALGGLHGALLPFHKENSDPVLAASILLSWQASDWNGWSSLMQGIKVVLSSMDAWKDTSRLAHYAQTQVSPQSSSFMQAPMSSISAPVLPEDDRSLEEAMHPLELLRDYVPKSHPLRPYVDDIFQSAQEIHFCYTTLPTHQLFEKLKTFRARLLWLPILLVQGPEHANFNLLIIAHLYAVAVAIDSSIPELNAAAFGGLAVVPIEEIGRRLRFRPSPTFKRSFNSPTTDDLMQFPRQIAAKTRYHISPVSYVSENLASGQQSPGYGFGNLRIGSAPTTPQFPPSFPRYANQSNEDLSVPPSPFLMQTYRVSPSSPRHSQLYEQHSRSNSMNNERHTYASASVRGDSPSYSPLYSPALTFSDDDYRSAFGEASSSYRRDSSIGYHRESSTGYHSGDSMHDDPQSKGKRRRIS